MEEQSPMITDWIMVGLTLVIAVFTYLVWKVYERIAWLTGAMESHSDLMLKIETLRGIRENQPIELIWWDPTIEDPPVNREHGKLVELNKIYVSIPPKYRRNKPTWKARFCNLFRLPET
jgi:hypothetical protein